jgi:uncharacterized protein (DUF2384 family)
MSAKLKIGWSNADKEFGKGERTMSGREASPTLSIDYLYGRAREIFGNPKKVHSWMNTPNLVFQGMKPKDFIEFGTDQDLQLVAEELDRIDQGVF